MHDTVNCAVLAALALLTVVTANTVSAQGAARASTGAYPTKPVRMIVPLAPGGGSDIVGRMVALELFNHWGQAVVVDNRPGAGSTVGTSIAAKAPADGYTVLVSSSSIAISPALYKSLDFDIRRDLAGVTLIASQPSILAVHSSVPVSSVKELIALARARPGKLAYASAGPGSATHLGTECSYRRVHRGSLSIASRPMSRISSRLRNYGSVSPRKVWTYTEFPPPSSIPL